VVKLLVLTLTLFAFSLEAEAQRVNPFGPIKPRDCKPRDCKPRVFIPIIGPDTEILVISKACASCIKAVRIISQLQSEGYDVVIINKRGTPAERALVKIFQVKRTPTLVICEFGEIPEKVVGLQTERKYRELISQ
jgi:hypothetical protein